MRPISNFDLAPPPENLCTQSKCKAILPTGYQYKTCEKCRQISKLSMQKKRKRDKDNEGSGPSHPQVTAPGRSDLEQEGPVENTYVGSDTDLMHDEGKVSEIYFEVSERILTRQTVQQSVPVQFEDKEAIMRQLKKLFSTRERISFHGYYDAPTDRLLSDKAHVTATAHEIWKVTGFRFV